MKFSHDWLSQYVSRIPQASELERLITAHSFQVEGIEKEGKDSVLDIDLLPNHMTYAASHTGVAREIAAITKQKFSLPKVFTSKIPKLPLSYLKVTDTTKSLVSAYHGVLLEDVQIVPSPEIIQKRLAAVGVRAINNVVDATNYVMLELGQPIHAFDYERIAGNVLTIQTAKKGEKVVILDGESRPLPEGAIILRDRDQITDLAGIMGGEASAITSRTHKVFLHAAIFDRNRIRLAEKAIGNRTEASLRYVHGMTPWACQMALQRAIQLLNEWSPKPVRVVGGMELAYKQKKNIPIKIERSYVCSLIGADIPAKEIPIILGRLGFVCTQKGRDTWNVVAPVWRSDIERQEDIVEEIGRMYGYDNVKSIPPLAHLAHPEPNDMEELADAMRDHFVALGYSEVENYALEAKKAFPQEFANDWRIKLANPFSEEYSYVRDSLVRGMLRNVDENITRAKGMKLFEIGRVYRKGQKGPEERDHAISVFVPEGKSQSAYFEAKGCTESLLERLGVTNIWLKDIDTNDIAWPLPSGSVMHPHRRAVIKVDSITIGVLYQLHPAVYAKRPVFVSEFLMPQLLEVVETAWEFRAIPKYPAVVRDIALLVDKDIRAQDVIDLIESEGGRELADVDLFDYYEGTEIGEDKKSLAFHLIFQSPDRTLTDAEVGQNLARIITALKVEGWGIRGESEAK